MSDRLSLANEPESPGCACCSFLAVIHREILDRHMQVIWPAIMRADDGEPIDDPDGYSRSIDGIACVYIEETSTGAWSVLLSRSELIQFAISIGCISRPEEIPAEAIGDDKRLILVTDCGGFNWFWMEGDNVA